MSVLTVIRNQREAAPLARWGARFALALEQPLILCVVMFDPLEGENREIDLKAPAGDQPEEALLGEVRAAVAEGLDGGDWPESTIRLCFATAKPSASVIGEVVRAEADLLLVGRQRSDDPGSPAALLGRQLFQRAPCQTVLMRLGESEGTSCRSVLVPAAGGRNSRVALRLASKILSADGRLTALYVEHPGSGLSKEVGQRMIERHLERTGIGADAGSTDRLGEEAAPIPSIEPRVEVAANTERGVAVAAADGYDLVLIGASHGTAIRQKLFGTLPERLLMGRDGTAVAVVRGPHPMAMQLRDRFERWLHLTVPQLEREDRIALHERLYSQGRWNFDFLTLIGLSTAIAALGLLADSSAVVIGAMLVAPLMTPLLGGGLALVQGNAQLFSTAIKAVAAGFLVALAIGALAGVLVPIDRTTEELFRRGYPHLLDLGVAFLSGIAAAYCVGRPNLSAALPGVAIAAALVPPIATSGITLARNEFDVAIGAGLLFGTNVVAVMLGAAISFYGGGIRGAGRRRWAIATMLVLCAAIVVLSVPLSRSLVADVIRPSVGGLMVGEATRTRLSNSVKDLGARLTEVSGYRQERKPVVDLTIEAGKMLPENDVETLRALLARDLGQPVTLRLKTILVQEAQPTLPTPAAPPARTKEPSAGEGSSD